MATVAFSQDRLIFLYGVTTQARITLVCAVQLKLDSFLYVLNNSTQTHPYMWCT